MSQNTFVCSEACGLWFWASFVICKTCQWSEGVFWRHARTWMSAFPSQLRTFYPLQPPWVVTWPHKWTLAECPPLDGQIYGATGWWMGAELRRSGWSLPKDCWWDQRVTLCCPKDPQIAIFWFHSCNLFVWKLCLYSLIVFKISSQFTSV